MSLKDTLLMPKTDFEMRGNLNIKEPKFLEKWDKEDIYHKNNEGKDKEFMLHDGPPYANGDMHMGHALNRILKDFVVRYKNMSGYKTEFVFGWDTHGLPIENMVTKSGVNRKATPVVEFRKKCEEYALTQVERQKRSIKRLGCLGDYDHPYLTLQKEYEAMEINAFSKIALKGLIYKGLKPVYWSPSSESALAEAEIEYKDIESTTVIVSFDSVDGKDLIPSDAKYLIWTTTPWTLPANLAICANPDFEYGLYETSIGKFVFLCSLKDKLTELIGFNDVKLIKTFKGKDLEGLKAKHPFYDKESLLINGDYVTDEDGTGLVHIAPGHGMDDYLVCLKYGIKPYCPVDGLGKMTKDAGPRLEGLFYEDANEEVLKMLKENNHLLNEKKIVHSYPHDWRTHKPIIFRATDQWFCSIDPIKDELIEHVHNVNWVPEWGENRMVNMIKDRSDWCISRQRLWGVPLPIIYCEDDTPLIEKEVFDHIEELFREHGSNIWYEKEAKDLLPNGYTNQHSPNGIYRKETDIMDVWFDSGSSWNSVLKERGMKYPSDLYLEGNDQYRGWFNSSLILSVANNNVPPFKSVVTHGFVMDEKWEKMSKSKGNGIDPLKIIETYGSDTLRLWSSLIDFKQDARISESIIKTISEQYRKIRNTFKFLLGNINNVTLDELNEVEIKEIVDLTILAKLERVKNEYLDSMDEYDFINATTKLLAFMSSDLSSFYLDITKDILYCEDKNSLRRKEVIKVLNTITNELMIMFNPILPFTMEEVNSFYPFKKYDNVMLYPMVKKSHYYEEYLPIYEKLMSLREDVLKACENKRNEGIIKSNQEASVTLNIFDTSIKDAYNKLSTKEEKTRFFIVSSISEDPSLNEDTLRMKVSYVKVTHSTGEKCKRCWNYFNENELTTLDNGEKVCSRCLKALKLRKY